MADKAFLARAEVTTRLKQSEWQCSWVRDYSTSALWRTVYGYYFSVDHEITENEFMDDVWKDLIANGKKPSLG